MERGCECALFGELLSHEGKRETCVACTMQAEQDRPLMSCYVHIECTASALDVYRFFLAEEIRPVS